MSDTEVKLIYIINSLHPGGAEMGLEMLLKNNFFDNLQVNIVCLSRSNSKLEERVESLLPGRVFYLTKSPVSNGKFFMYVIKFLTLIRKFKPDVVVCSLSQSVLVSRIAKLFFKFNLITFEHNTEFQNKLAWFLMKKTDFLTNYFWCDSKSTERSLKLRYRSSKVRNLPLFYMENNNKQKSIYSKGRVFEIISVGRLAPQKNYFDAIDAVYLIKSSGIDVKLTIYGEGELRDQLTIKVRELDLVDNVCLKGFVQNWKLEAIDYDAYLLMSDFEGLSISTLEAMSIGLPCIVRPVGELKNYITHNSTGLIVNTSKDVLAVIERLINEPGLAKKIGVNARDYVICNHSEHAFKEKCIQARTDIERIHS